MGGRLRAVYFILYTARQISVVRMVRQDVRSHDQAPTTFHRETQTGSRARELTDAKNSANYRRIRAAWKAKSRFPLSPSRSATIVVSVERTKLRSLFGRRYGISNTSGESVIRAGGDRKLPLRLLISEANHPELLRRPTNHFQPSVPDRRQFQYISRDYKHSEGLINFALSHRPYPWASY